MHVLWLVQQIKNEGKMLSLVVVAELSPQRFKLGEEIGQLKTVEERVAIAVDERHALPLRVSSPFQRVGEEVLRVKDSLSQRMPVFVLPANVDSHDLGPV